MNRRIIVFAMAVMGGGLSFLIVTSVMQPGLLDLTTPSHSDFYRYFLISEKRWLPSDWLAPRPLMLAFLKIAGVFHQPQLLYLVLAIPALLFVSLCPYVVNRVGLAKSRILPWLIFFIVAFGSPYFHQIRQFDFGGMLSGFFAVMATYLGITALNRKDKNCNLVLGALAFCLASIESKPTYSFALLYLALVGVALFKNRKSILIFGGVLIILTWVFVKDKIFGSPFVASAEALSPYAVVVNPVQNFRVLAFYVFHAFTAPLFFATVLSLVTLAACRNWKSAIIPLGLSISAAAPMALLVNRQWESYSWYSTIAIALLVMIAVDRLLLVVRESIRPKVRVGAILVLVALLASIVAHALTRHPSVEWTLTNQTYNRNVLQAMESIEPMADGRKVLIAGIKGPYHPFKNTAYVTQRYPRIGQFDLLLRKSEEEWNRMSHELTNGVHLEQLEKKDYSLMVVFGADGRIVEKVPSSKFGGLTSMSRDVLLVCGMTVNQDPTTVARIIDCLNDAGEFGRAIDIGRQSISLGERQPWIYYHLSKSYIKIGDAENAHALAIKALSIEPGNKTFQRAAEDARESIKGARSIVN